MNTNLNNTWKIQSSAKIQLSGEKLSVSGEADTSSWYQADLPATVLGTMVENGDFEDPFFGTNFLNLPGQGPAAENFSNHEMPEDSPFNVSWWYRKEFTVPADAKKYLSLKFDGINYRANIWLNGNKIADSDTVVGSYRDYEFDITKYANRNGTNVLAVEVFASLSCDLAITWVDWNPSPTDKNLGLWRDVWLCSNHGVAIDSPHVVTKLEGHDLAHLTIGGDLKNVTDKSITATVNAQLDGKKLSWNMLLNAGETKRFEENIDIKSPKLWWPRMMGSPELYNINLEVLVDEKLSDESNFNFGIREVKGEMTKEGYAAFRINGEPVLIRGAGWATDIFLRRQPERDFAQLEYVKDMNLNTVRFEGMFERPEFIEWCDKEGMMVISGWCCCDFWEKWDNWKEENFEVSAESLRSQIRRLRRHPSLITFWYGSDFAPPPRVEKAYLEVFEQEHWPNATTSSAADKPTDITGPSGMKMEGPYDYVPPGYWLEDTKLGGAFGFATEVCAGPAVPPIESLKKMLPKDNLWPIDSVWNFHAGGQEFHNIKIFADALFGRYGKMDNVEDFAKYSQLVTYEATRSMFEAYARNKPKATGVIQWMLNNSWPSLIWHLYDYYLRPAGGYFGSKIGCEPLHVMYSYDNASIVVTNDYLKDFKDLTVNARVLSLDATELYNNTVKVNVDANKLTTAFTIPKLEITDAVYFVDLTMTNNQKEIISRNFYWISKEPDVLDHENGMWIHTPISKCADMSQLGQLSKAEIEVYPKRQTIENEEIISIELKNTSAKIAFFVQLNLVDGTSGDDVLPVLWSDNYVSLLPMENRTIILKECTFNNFNNNVQLIVEGINVLKKKINL